MAIHFGGTHAEYEYHRLSPKYADGATSCNDPICSVNQICYKYERDTSYAAREQSRNAMTRVTRMDKQNDASVAVSTGGWMLPGCCIVCGLCSTRFDYTTAAHRRTSLPSHLHIQTPAQQHPTACTIVCRSPTGTSARCHPPPHTSDTLCHYAIQHRPPSRWSPHKCTGGAHTACDVHMSIDMSTHMSMHM